MSFPLNLSRAEFARFKRMEAAAKKAKRADRVRDNALLDAFGVDDGSGNAVLPVVPAPRQASALPRLGTNRRPNEPGPKRAKSKPRRQIKHIAQLSSRGALKKAIVRLLGLLDRKINGPLCRYGALCPAYKKIGVHNGDTACHLSPQQRGEAARLLPENVVWGCSDANFGEVNNRDLYRQHHVVLFGRERVERIEAIARTTRQYSTAELREIRASVKAQLEARAS